VVGADRMALAARLLNSHRDDAAKPVGEAAKFLDLAAELAVDAVTNGFVDGGNAPDSRFEGSLADRRDGQIGLLDGVGELVGQINVDLRHRHRAPLGLERGYRLFPL
jgi:hypothetical protein